MPKCTARVEGRWLVQLVSAGGIIKRELEFPNLVTDVGLDFLHTMNGAQMGNSTMNYCAVGTGSTAPAGGDTALVSEVARTNAGPTFGSAPDVSGGYDTPGNYGFARLTWEFDFSVANGNLTEIGIFSASSAGTMFCRALFTDSGGTPTTVVKTSADKLRVRYEWRILAPAITDTVESSYDIDGLGTLVDISHRPVGLNSGGAWGDLSRGPVRMGQSDTQIGRARNSNTAIGHTTLDNGGTNCSAATWASYTGGSFARELELRWDTGVANFAGGTPGIGGVGVSLSNDNRHMWDFVFSPRVQKDNTKRFFLEMEFAFTR